MITIQKLCMECRVNIMDDNDTDSIIEKKSQLNKDILFILHPQTLRKNKCSLVLISPYVSFTIMRYF